MPRGRPIGATNKKGRKPRRGSHCVGLASSTCASTSGCKYTNGSKRKFCRKSSKSRRRRKATSSSYSFSWP